MATAWEGAIRSAQAPELQLLIHLTPSLIHTSRPDGYLDFFNQTWLRYVGRSLEHLQGWKWTVFIHPDDIEAMVAKWRTSLASGEPFLHEARVLRADGEYRWMLHHKVAARNSQGAIVRWYGSSIDIQERKCAEEALRQSEFYLAEAQKLTHVGSWVWDVAEGDALHLSDEWYRIYGFDPKHGMPKWEERLQRVHPEDRDKWQGTIERAIRESSEYEVEFRILLPDGTLKWIHTVAHPVLNKAGELLQFVGSSMDVTERKRAEQNLCQSEAYLAEAQKLSQTGSWALNLVQNIRYWSEECYRVLGFDPRGPLPTFEQFLKHVHPEDQHLVQEQYEKSIREKSDFEMDYRLVHPTTGIRDIHVVGRAILGRSGELVEHVGTVIDVTERKRAEQELQQLADFVPQLIAVFDSHGKLIHANRVVREYIGLTLDEFRSLDLVGRIIHPDDVERVRATRERGIAGNEPFELDARWLGKDGIYRWFLTRYNPLVEEGRVRRWYMSATEIESRKQEEERIRQENVRLEERTRIARELHDTLLQTVQSASLHLGAALYEVTADSPVKPRLERTLQLMTQGIEEGRSAIQGLRAFDSHPSDLVLALSRIREELKVQPDVDLQVMVAGQEMRWPPQIQNEIYRIGREALINAFRHSGAKRVELELEYTDSALCMRIRDQGCGIDPAFLERGREGHWGVAGMRERATRIGGLLKISSNAMGTEVELSLPCNDAVSS